MSEIEKERFCSNSDCKFHNHYVSVGSKYLEYADNLHSFGQAVQSVGLRARFSQRGCAYHD